MALDLGRESLAGTDHPDVMRHVTSFDGGLTWSATADLPVPNEITLIRAVSDACGVIHVIAGYAPDGRPAGAKLLYARVGTDGKWTNLSDPFPSLTLTDPDLTVGQDGVVRLAALRWAERAGPRESRVRTILSELVRQR